ncbi:thiolase family protein [Amycolatopsis alkalitolerans]|uniref:propanoyl-CoA C-acyltransferase n=1 Tax=Amycolatopsis alkalitolerans TaxID=2547244 RepID=A0A5C4M4S4_9PSEU|nr:thiolase family protein [Amycolatopsis alkalitolerans]TNC26415.1 thiolase family protein [Amycolatopsis alkalitolerans]
MKRPDERVYVIGIGATPVGRHVDLSFTDLVQEAYTAAVTDARLADPDRIEATWFANVMMDFWGQRSMRGHAVMLPLIEEKHFPDGQRITNVEGACASGSVAFHGAWSAVKRGADLTLAVGVEKMNDAERPGSEILQWMEGVGNQLYPDAYYRPLRELAAEFGLDFALDANRSFAMDYYALLALSHMRDYGTTAEHIAAAAAKNHTNAVGNPRAQYRFPMTVEEVLADRTVVAPLTRAMCAPRGDGAAAALVCSEGYLKQQPSEVQDRALLVRGHSIAGGKLGGTWESDRSTVRCAEQTFRMAGLTPQALDLVEVHDATAFAEMHLVEDLGLCPRGQGGPFTESGATARDGQIPVNASGGLVSRGHPIGATGIIMLNEIAAQLRGEAGECQVPDARIAMAENGGGVHGLDTALCSTTILQRA